jgi:hypothetical protein
MKKFLFCLVALIAVVAMVMPAYAVESKFAGSFRVRFLNNDNVTNGDDDIDDNQTFMDQRLRLYYYAVASENLRFVYKLEVGDLTWGQPGSVGKSVGGSRGLDGVNIETKNVYVDFTMDPVRCQLGGQGVVLHRGFWLDDDFMAARFDAKFDPVALTLYYAWHTNSDVTDTSDDIWNTAVSLAYAAEMFNIRGSLGWQRAQNSPTLPAVDSDDLYTLMVDAGFKGDMWSAFFTGGVNFGSIDGTGGVDDQDYKGFLLDGGANFSFDPFSLGIEMMYVSGDDDAGDGDIESFTYFSGRSHYWAEILGLGTLDRVASTVGDDGPGADFAQSGTESSGLWATKVGGSWQALENTKLTLNVWYVMLAEDRVTGGEEDDKIGTEVDFYLDQKLMDNLKFRFVGAYLFADDAFSPTQDDADDAYELGARVQMDW